MPEIKFPNFPSDRDFDNIIKTVVTFEKLKKDIAKIKTGMVLEDAAAIQYLLTNTTNNPADWKMILNRKIEQLSVNYTCAQYYFNLGINDDEWWKNNYEKGCIEYLPNVTNQEFSNKAMFDLFINNVFNVIFSAFDIIAQLINAKWQLGVGVRSVSYNALFFDEGSGKRKPELYKKLKDKAPSLQQGLSAIRDSEMQSTIDLRNHFTHKIPPTEVMGLYLDDPEKITSIDQIPEDTPSSVKESWEAVILAGKTVTVRSIKVGKYKTSTEIFELTEKAMMYLEKTIKVLAR